MTEDDLLDAIAESPNDDGPRLVYADWLQQQGDETRRARGEYISLCCTSVRPKPAAKTQELLDKYGAAWLGPIAPLTNDLRRVWSRGFLDSCELQGRTVRFSIEPALDHPAWRVLRALYTDSNGHYPTFEDIARLICQRAMANLKALRAGAPVLRLVAESALAPRISELDFHPIGVEHVETLLPLLDADCFVRLRKLTLFRLPRDMLVKLFRPKLEVIGLLGPPRSLLNWLADLTSLSAPLSEFRLLRNLAGSFENRENELVLHGVAGRWSHLEVRWSYEDIRHWRDEVIATVAQIPAGAIERLSFVGSPSARFDVTRFKHRVTAALPGAIVV